MARLATPKKVVGTKRRLGSIFERTEDYGSNSEEVNDKVLKIFRGLTYNLEDDIKMLTPKERVELSIRLMPHMTNMLEFSKLQEANVEQKNQFVQMFRRVQ